MDPPRTIVDDLFWLRDDTRSSEEVLELLKAENEYTNHCTKHLEGLREKLYEEMLSRIMEDDETVPYEMGDFEYFSRTIKGEPFRQFVRRRPGGEEEVYLDVNVVSKTLEKPAMCDVGEVEVSKSGALVAFTLDQSGYETYDIIVRNIESGEDVDVLKDTAGSVCWSNDEKTLFYVSFDSAHRPYKCWRHTIGTSQSEDVLLYEEPDQRFNVACWKELDGSMIVIESESKETTELRLYELGGEKETRLVRPREDGVRYSIASHAPSRSLYLLSNAFDCHNKAVFKADLDQPAKWETIVPHSERSLEGSITAFADKLVVTGRENGFTQVWTISLDEAGAEGPLKPVFDDNSASTVRLGANRVFDRTKLRVIQTSLTAPLTTLDYDPSTSSFETLKVAPSPNYDSSLYKTSRVECLSRDGETKVPMTLLWRPDRCSSTPPVHLYGYGSYGISMDPSFSPFKLSLCDRGVVFAIAHVRGGGEMGDYDWYRRQGKYLTKMNTFNDFVDCAHRLKEIYPDSDVSIEGRSAGGLLVGNAINMEPTLFKACLAGVPFVDLMVTMCDSSIPLTTEEWEEWGCPNQEKYFEYMLGYSPINQVVENAEYPNVFITSGLNDPRVAYWEPTKWAQVLRAKIQNGDDVLLKMDLDAGHFSASDRYRYIRELAFDYAWLLDQLNAANENGE